MKRLRDEHANSPLLRKAQDLLAAIEPLPDSEARMLKVRRALDRPGTARSAGATLALLRRIPALALAGLVVLFGASAFAAVRYIAARSAAVEPAALAASPSGNRRAHRHRARHVPAAAPLAPAPMPPVTPTARPQLAPSPAPTALPSTAPAPTAVASVAANAVPPDRASTLPPARAERTANARAADRRNLSRASSRGRSSSRAGAPRISSTAEPRQPAAEARPEADSEREGTTESALVHRAVQALRRDGDPALAARLLAQSRAHSANGPLAEEALSLQIEAATALSDPRARKFAREYLTRYPQGRYLDMARGALAGH